MFSLRGMFGWNIINDNSFRLSQLFFSLISSFWSLLFPHCIWWLFNPSESFRINFLFSFNFIYYFIFCWWDLGRSSISTSSISCFQIRDFHQFIHCIHLFLATNSFNFIRTRTLILSLSFGTFDLIIYYLSWFVLPYRKPSWKSRTINFRRSLFT